MVGAQVFQRVEIPYGGFSLPALALGLQRVAPAEPAKPGRPAGHAVL